MSAMMPPQGSGANKPEAKVVVPVLRGVAVTNSGMRVVGGIVPAAAANHTVTASVFLYARSPFSSGSASCLCLKRRNLQAEFFYFHIFVSDFRSFASDFHIFASDFRSLVSDYALPLFTFSLFCVIYRGGFVKAGIVAQTFPFLEFRAYGNSLISVVDNAVGAQERV